MCAISRSRPSTPPSYKSESQASTAVRPAERSSESSGSVRTAPSSGKVSDKKGQNFSIPSTAKAGEWEIVGLGGSGGYMKESDIKAMEAQGFRFLGGGGPKGDEGDKSAYLFARQKEGSDTNVKTPAFAKHTMYVYDTKTTAELKSYGLDLGRAGSSRNHTGSYERDRGARLSGISFVTTDDGVKSVKAGRADVLGAKGSDRGDGGFLAYGRGTFTAERNDRVGGRQLQSVSFSN